jgi:hypothetical protein
MIRQGSANTNRGGAEMGRGQAWDSAHSPVSTVSPRSATHTWMCKKDARLPWREQE